MKRSVDRIFLTWLPYSRRSQTLAENFAAEPVYFRYLSGKGNVPKALLRYVVMTIHTMLLILRRKPKLVFVMNQPIFLPLTVFLLSRWLKFNYVIDSHSGLFNKPQWKWSLPIMKYAYRHSLFSIVTNQRHRRLVESWEGRVEVLGALSVNDEPFILFDKPDQPCFVVIGTFAEDEPTEAMVEACRMMPQVRFYITGALKRAPQDLLKNAPENVIFTDFQPRGNYVGLVRAMDGAIILVKNADVMQMGAYEAMSWAIPIITSDWEVLRENFYRGALFVDNTPQTIKAAVQEILRRNDFYKAEIAQLRQERRLAWDQQIARINAFIVENT
ncbi:MAG: glycosyltransferase [bacterium]